jgi:hypothetical protein
MSVLRGGHTREGSSDVLGLGARTIDIGKFGWGQAAAIFARLDFDLKSRQICQFKRTTGVDRRGRRE